MKSSNCKKNFLEVPGYSIIRFVFPGQCSCFYLQVNMDEENYKEASLSRTRDSSFCGGLCSPETFAIEFLGQNLHT